MLLVSWRVQIPTNYVKEIDYLSISTDSLFWHDFVEMDTSSLLTASFFHRSVSDLFNL